MVIFILFIFLDLTAIIICYLNLFLIHFAMFLSLLYFILYLYWNDYSFNQFCFIFLDSLVISEELNLLEISSWSPVRSNKPSTKPYHILSEPFCIFKHGIQ